jgi:hypothetical protein
LKPPLVCNQLHADLPDYSKITFPSTPPIPLERVVPTAKADELALFKQFITYDSARRISAEQALLDPYFYNEPLPSRLSDMPKPQGGRRARSVGGEVAAGAEEVSGEVRTFADIFHDLLSLKY